MIWFYSQTPLDPYLELIDPCINYIMAQIDLLDCKGSKSCVTCGQYTVYSTLMWSGSQQLLNGCSPLAQPRIFYAGGQTRPALGGITCQFESEVHWIQISLWRFEARTHLRLVKMGKDFQISYYYPNSLLTFTVSVYFSKKVLIFYLCN